MLLRAKEEGIDRKQRENQVYIYRFSEMSDCANQKVKNIKLWGIQVFIDESF